MMNETLSFSKSFVLVALAGLMGAAGVMLAAQAAHASLAPGNLAILNTAALFMMIHAAVLPAITALCLILASTQQMRLARAVLGGGLILCVGAVVFSCDLATRAMLDHSLFALAAPIGGIVMIAGWVILAVLGMFAVFAK